MKRSFIKLLLLMLFYTGTLSAQDLVKEVDTKIGSGAHGHTYPGATVPHGAVQLSPDTRRGNWDACAGYHYSDSTILGFSHTHLSGTGCIDFGDILFYPMNRICLPQDAQWMKPLRFTHADELCLPGYYAVECREEKIRIELTATRYTGMHRYHFVEDTPALIIDLAHALDNEHIYQAQIQQTAMNELAGMRCTRGWTDKQHVYFVARFSHPFQSFDTIHAPATYPPEVVITGHKIQAAVSFAIERGTPLIVQIGLSLVSIESARKNLEHDFYHFNFDATQAAATKQWEGTLADIVIEGGSPEQRTNFYTALYHCRVVPNIVSDCNGAFRQHNMTIDTSSHSQYSTLSLWDTFRAWHPLMTLIDTTLSSHIIHSMLNIYNTTGELPIWPLATAETGTMIGYHSASVIADAWMKDIRGFDGQQALTAMITSAEKNVKGAREYIQRGFIPTDNRKETVSCLLEYAYDDWSIARMAYALGEQEIATRFFTRSLAYSNVFDGSTRFFRGKRADGNWETPFDPYQPGRAYTEATAWQYRFFVPHDVNGMLQLYGGKKAFIKELDKLFLTSSEIKGEMSDITGLIGQYAHGNEPSHHMAYLYNYVGQPWKTQELTRNILDKMYAPTPEGICGNEDCGQMSAWYILSSLGIYSVCPGTGEFLLTTPLFPKATIKLANGKKMTITANQSDKNRYIEKVHLNGKEITCNYLTYQQLMNGGELIFELSENPNQERGTDERSLPYSYSQEKQVSIPYIDQDLHLFTEPLYVTLATTTANATIRYTLDDSEPNQQSTIYHEPILIQQPSILKAKGFKANYLASRTLEITATPAAYRTAETGVKLRPGAAYNYYEGEFKETKEMVATLPVKTGVMPQPMIKNSSRNDHFGYQWIGWIYIPKRGVYEFQITSDDGSLLYIGGQKVVDNDGSHAAISANGKIALEKGYHPYTLLYFEDYEGEMFDIVWKIPGAKTYENIPAKSWHTENVK